MTHPHLFIRIYTNRSSIVICTWAKATYCVRRTPKVVIIVGIIPLFIPVSATKSAIRLRMRISEKSKDSLAKSMNFNSIWLKNRSYYSQIEQFSLDLAIEHLVDTFLFHSFQLSLRTDNWSFACGSSTGWRPKSSRSSTPCFTLIEQALSVFFNVNYI